MIKKIAIELVKLGLTLGMLLLLARKIDLSAAWEAGKGLSPWVFLGSVGLLLIQVQICTLRWRWVAMSLGSRLRMVKALEIYWISNFFGLVLPGAVGGDAVRMWKTRREGLPLSASVNSVMLERLSTVLGLVLMVSLAQPLLADRLPHSATLWVFPLLSVGGIAGVIFLCLVHHFPRSFHRWALWRMVGQLAHDTRRVYLRPRHLGRLALTVFGGLLNLSLAVWVLAWGLDAPLSLLDSLVLIPPVILITTLPISLAGWGARELAMVTILGFVGVPEHQSLVISILFGMVTTITALPGGVWWLLSADRSAMTAETQKKA